METASSSFILILSFISLLFICISIENNLLLVFLLLILSTMTKANNTTGKSCCFIGRSLTLTQCFDLWPNHRHSFFQLWLTLNTSCVACFLHYALKPLVLIELLRLHGAKSSILMYFATKEINPDDIFKMTLLINIVSRIHWVPGQDPNKTQGLLLEDCYISLWGNRMFQKPNMMSWYYFHFLSFGTFSVQVNRFFLVCEDSDSSR